MGPKWPKVAQTLRENLDGPKWPKIPASHHVWVSGQKGPKVTQTAKVAQSGPKWPKVAQSGPKWPKVTQSGPDPQRELGWPKVAQSGPKFRPPIIALKILKVHFFWDTLYGITFVSKESNGMERKQIRSPKAQVLRINPTLRKVLAKEKTNPILQNWPFL